MNSVSFLRKCIALRQHLGKMDWAGLTGGSFLVPDRFGEVQIQK